MAEDKPKIPDNSALMGKMAEKLKKEAEEKQEEERLFKVKVADFRQTAKETYIKDLIDKIWDTYDFDGDDMLNIEEAKDFFKDTLNVLSQR